MGFFADLFGPSHIEQWLDALPIEEYRMLTTKHTLSSQEAHEIKQALIARPFPGLLPPELAKALIDAFALVDAATQTSPQ